MGRILVTLLVLAFFPWSGLVGFSDAMGPLMLWYLLGYTMAATFVLRHTWRRERVSDELPGRLDVLRGRLAGRSPFFARRVRVDARLLLVLVSLAVVIALGLAWSRSDSVGRYYLTAVAAVAGTGVFLAWLNEL